MPVRTKLRWAAVMTATMSIVASARSNEPIGPTISTTDAGPDMAAAGHSLHGEVFDDGPRHKAELMPGMGNAHFAVTTSDPRTQAFMDQGVAQLHSFLYFEAERSFRQASMTDPNCAMAYWGMAMANVNNPPRAQGFLAEARKREAHATQREKRYLIALQSFYAEDMAPKARKQAFQNGLKSLVEQYPDDLNARAWLALVSWQNGANETREALDQLIDSVLQADPLHPGAHHYRIHLWDGHKPSRSLGSAALSAKAAPGIAHAWHMPGHAYSRLARHIDAAYHQEGAARVDHAYMLRYGLMPFEIHNYVHNNQWLVTSFSHIGRVHGAIAVARSLVEQPRDPDKNGKSASGSAQRSGRLRWAEVLTRYELWNELIAVTESGELDWSNNPVELKEKAYRLGLAYAAKGDQAGLVKQITALKALRDAPRTRFGRSFAASSDNENQNQEPGAPRTRFGMDFDGSSNEGQDQEPGPPRTRLGMDFDGSSGILNRSEERDQSSGVQAALAELEGYRLLTKGDVKDAFDQFAKATSMRPEALARAHLATRNFGLAEEVARKSVKDRPHQIPPLAALVEVLHIVGKDGEARKEFNTLESLSQRVDWDAPVMKRLGPIVAAWKAGETQQASRSREDRNDAQMVERIDLEELGPLIWSPSTAEPFSLVDTDGQSWTLRNRLGRNVVVLFFLGGKCAHCMQQLEIFGEAFLDLKRLHTDLVGISTDDLGATRALRDNPDRVVFPMPLLADPTLEIFKRYFAYDDFEGHPLHAIYVIDSKGQVRYRRISAEPFLDPDFVKSEIVRINRIVPPSRP